MIWIKLEFLAVHIIEGVAIEDEKKALLINICYGNKLENKRKQ